MVPLPGQNSVKIGIKVPKLNLIINEIKSKFPIFEKIKQNTRCAIRGHSFQVSESPNPSKTIHGYDHT